MNEEQKNQLMQVLIGITEKGEQVATDIYTVLQEQSPQLVQEIINWGFFKHISSVMFFLVFCLVLLYPLIKCWKYTIKRGSDDDWVCAILLTAFFLMVPFIGMFVNIFCAVKIYIAPRLYMLEYIKDFIN